MSTLERHVVIAPRPSGSLTDEFLNTRLRTVEDVHRFFQLFLSPPSTGGRAASIPRAPPFKFVYCAKVDCGLEFRPYDIVVVKRGEQPRNHYVVSPTAVVHVNGTTGVEETKLIAQWLRESKQFDAIRRITFFKQFLKRKALTMWLKSISRSKFLQSREKLSKRLFISRHTFAESTIQLRKLAFDLRLVQKDLNGRIPAVTKPSQFSSIGQQQQQQASEQHKPLDASRVSKTHFPIRLIYYPDARPQWGYTTEGFTDAESNHYLRVAMIMQRNIDDMISILSKVCEKVAQRAAVPDMATLDQLDQFLGQNSHVKGTIGPLYKQEKEIERQQRKRELKRCIVENDYLQPWIRLIDLMIGEELFLNIISTFDTFAKHLELPTHNMHRDLRISYQVQCVFQGDQPMKFTPDEATIRSLVINFIHDTIRKVSTLPRLIDVKELRPYFYKTPTAQQLPTVVSQYPNFDTILSRVEQQIQHDFTDGLDKGRVYEACRSCLQFVAEEWQQEFATWMERANDRNKERMLQETDIKKFIQRVNKCRLDLSRMTNKHCGVLSINIEPLTQELSQKLDNVLNDIKQALMTLANRRVHEVGKMLETSIAALKYPPMELRDFAEWVDRANRVESESQSLLQECSEVESLYLVAEENGFDMPQHFKDKRDRTVGSGKGTEPLRVQFTQAIANARQHRENNAEEMKSQLHVAIMDTVGVLDSITEELRHGEYREATHTSSLILSKLHGVSNTLQSLRNKRDVLNNYCSLLGSIEPEWQELKTATEVYERKNDLWTTVARWEERRSYWNRTPVSQMDGEKMKEEMTELFQKSHKLNKLDPDGVTDRLLNGISVEKANLPVMAELCNPALKEEHWIKIFDGIGKRLPPPDARTLETMRTYGAYQHQELINTVSAVATGEYTLVKQINKIANVWDKMEFVLVKNKDSESNFVLGGIDEIMLELEDNQVQVQTCLASRYVGGIRQSVEEWDTKLQLIRDVIDEWVNVQKSWMYLEFIFSSDDIKKQLPEESKMFSQVDKIFRTLMTKAGASNNVAAICCEEGVLVNLRSCTASLDRVQKKLEDYLETKRVAFPRFYFLSNDELLSILSDVRNPTAVQPHLQKCFDNIKELRFDDSHTISAMRSTEGEEVPFPEKIKVVGNVENWLNDIERMMRRTLYEITGDAVAKYKQQKRTEWFFNFPAQSIGCVDQIVWTDEMEQVWQKISDGNPKACHEYIDFYRKQILDTVELVKGKLTKLQRTCVCTLIVIDVHNRDVVTNLIDVECTTSVDFNWQKQLRYYWMDGGSGKVDCHIHHSAARVTYGYEYLGNQLRLVITPLTERAFLTCTSALHIFQGAAPQGPAGTGKTESVKDLGKALARQVVVFNCSDGLNYKMMSQMFAGLAQAGAWACFDEFNRIEIEVLSVVAQQMLEITTAIANKQDSMIFDGHKIRLHKNFGVFITMNPGYAGRTELPDNLKALFRPICMMIPDYALIAEIMFFSEGFSDARPLAQKMVRLYSLASQQLSKQDHYDFGMRAVKSILVMAGSLKRAEPNNPEDMILIRAMRDSNVPKFLREDTKLFMALINDLFPCVEIKEVLSEDLDREIRSTLQSNGHQVVELFIEKVLQLYETMVVRHGVMLVGQTITGKTTNARTLSQTLTNLHTKGIAAQHDAHKRFYFPARIWSLNPKSITMGEMYGDINRITREWQDGVLSNIVRELVRMTTPDRYWVNFDGPVDAIWIENMNTVLDDNKLLCLVNGERIKIPETISILFEVQDLRVASPATVSRCGMVFMEPYYLDDGWSPIAKTMSEKINAAGAVEGRWRHERFMDLCQKLVPPVLTFLRRECKEYIGTVDAQLVINLVELLHASLINVPLADDGDDVETPGKVKPPVIGEPDQRKMFDLLYIQCYIYAFGGNTNDKTRKKIAVFMQQQIKDLGFVMPEQHSCFDYFVHKASLTWQPWSYKVPIFQFNPAASYFDLLVPTTDTVILRHLLWTASTVKKHVLVNGVTGTGKSSAVANFLVTSLQTEDPNSKFTAFSITFSAQTSSLNFQETVESKLVRRRGDKELGPPPGKRMIAMVDDCNMPQLETYGASPPIELMRQIISQGGIYDRKKLFFKEIIDLMFVACCGEPGGGKNELTPRLTSNFVCFCATALSSSSMRTIFNGILRGFLQNGFAASVVALAENCVSATIEIYERIANEMLPTPEKTHYTFNLRDISKVVQGMLQVLPARCPGTDQFYKLWTHESSRVFHDRLINEHDRNWWWHCVVETAKKHFNITMKIEEIQSIMYGSWADKKSVDYKEVPEPKFLQELLKEAQIDYNTSKMKDVDLVLFDDAIGHLGRICRILRQPRGNALLVGVGGSGRHSLCELASSICSMDCKGIVIVRNYGVNEFREDVKKFLLDAGAANKPIVFLLADNQLIFNQMLEDINNILNIGEVPGLMGPEEFDKIMSSCRESARAANKPETRNGLYQFFVSRCRENLHIMLCMSPIGAQFRDKLRMFPSLVNCMTIDWFTAWPRDALLSVAQRILAKLDVGSETVKKGVCEIAVHMHVTVKSESEEMFASLRRRNYTTPTSYLSLLALYQEVYEEQNKSIGDNVKRYKNGLDKLDSTNATIEQLKKKIREMQPVLAKASKEADEQQAQLIVEQAEVDQVKVEVSNEEATARALMAEAEGIKKECEDGLAEALPALAAAEKALQTLSQKDIGEIKTFTTPPTNVEKTMNAVLILLKEKDGWATAKQCLSKMDFLSRLTGYNRDDIAPAIIRKLTPFIQDKEFVPDVIEKTSLPCRSMCMWVHAMYKYYHVAKEIEPKRNRLKDAEAKVAEARAILQVKQARLKQVIEKIEALQKAAKETAERKASLESQIVEAEAKLGRADQLIGGLSAERIRWEQQLKTLKAQKHNVVGTMALAAGCVAYLGPFPSTYRVKLVADWTARAKELNIPCDEGFSLDRLPDQYTVREWALQSLPQDPFSIENATVLQRSKRWCLMIDPQGQANTFIRKKEGSNKLKVIKLTDDNYMRSVESAIQVGHPVLLENVGETLDAALDPVLLKQPVRLGGRLVLKLGEKEVDYDPTFRFYITTKMPNPLFSPELQIKVTIVNFTVTRKGLEDQLLSDIVGFERSDLQEKSDQCVVAIAKGKAEIKGLEDAILKMLAESTGDILDNVELINTLSASKKTSDAIAKDLEVVEATNAEIDTAREEYRILATRGSLVYGVVADLSVIDPMYQYSLTFFKSLFLTTLERTARVGPTEEAPDAPHESVKERVMKLIPAVTWTSFSVICRGLFEKDKLLFSFMLGMIISRHAGTVSDAEWLQFIRGNAGAKLPPKYATKPVDWLEVVPWEDFVSLCTAFPDKFQHVLDHFVGNPDQWRAWVLAEDLYEKSPPCSQPSSPSLSEWHRAMMIKAFRPEKLNFTMARVVSDYLGKEFSVSPQFSLKEAFLDSTNMTPLIFVLSTGTDPTVLFTTFAEEMGYKEKKLMLSLGQDQGKRAAQMIEEGKKDGLWVYLQNCHVYVSWMPALERLVEQFKPEDIHPDFRLWLTSNPSPAFPVPVLQSGMKLTREPPKGLKANLKDSVHSLDVSIWSEQDGQPKERQWKKLVFALTFFHALVQERRKFGALGWNIAYEWSAPDLSASVKTLRIAINDFDDIPWSAIQYTIGVLNYGGRVTDFLDNRCLQAVAMKFFRPELFDGECKFDAEGLYFPPEPCTKDELLAYVENLPQYESPQLFGLHSNANISFQAKESNAVMTTMIEMQPRGGGGGGGGKTPDQVVSEIADDLLSRCPDKVDPEKAHPSSFAVTANGTMISLGTVLSQEIEQFNRLLGVTKASLMELKRAIKGEVVMSATMEMMYNSLTFNKVPDNWKKVGYLCLKPLASYYLDLIERIKFIGSWCYEGAPTSFWLPGLFFPQGFITGVFQTHSRKHKMSIDSIKFRFHFSHGTPTGPPESGVYTHGYFLEGASWSSDGKLCESRPGILFTQLPTIHLDPVPLTDKDPPSVYECPLYKASTRAGVLSTTGLSTNFVLTMQLPSPTDIKPDHWINRGVAALCMLDT